MLGALLLLADMLACFGIVFALLPLTDRRGARRR